MKLGFACSILLAWSQIREVKGLITYPNRTTVATGSTFVTGLLVEDFTGDNEKDVIVMGPQVLKMTRRFADGSFSLPSSLGQTGNEGAQAADIDGDGDKDIVMVASADFAQGVQDSLRVFWNNGQGAFGKRTLMSTQRLVGDTTTIAQVNGRDVKIMDMNGDGYKDLIVTVSTPAFASPAYGFLLLFTNDGTGRFTREILAEDLAGPALVSVSDLNLDGYMDIVVLEVSIMPRTRDIRVFYGNSEGTYTSSTVDSGAEGSMGLSIGFLDDDDYPDILTVGLKDIAVYFGKASGGFKKKHLVRFDTSMHKSVNYRDWQIMAHDANGDGLNDIVAVYGLHPGVHMMRQLPDGEFSSIETLVPVETAGEFYLSDIDQDGVPDILVHSESEGALYLYLGLSDETPSPSSIPTVVPSSQPTESPSSHPSASPSVTASVEPTVLHSDSPSNDPSEAPSDLPSEVPTIVMSETPSAEFSENPTVGPSGTPTSSPSDTPSAMTSDPPSMVPTETPVTVVDPRADTDEPTTSVVPEIENTTSPTLDCIPMGQACTDDSECCGLSDQVYCAGKCKPRIPVDSKDDTTKLFEDDVVVLRGNLGRRRRDLQRRQPKGSKSVAE